jgi:hypothetical protein
MSTSPLSPEGGRAAADQHQEPVPEYSDAALVPFLEKVEQAIAARVDARLAAAAVGPAPARAAGPVRRPGDRSPARRIIRGAVAVGGGALLVAGLVGLRVTDSRSFVPGPRGVGPQWVHAGPWPGGPRRIILLPDNEPARGFRR